MYNSIDIVFPKLLEYSLEMKRFGMNYLIML